MSSHDRYSIPVLILGTGVTVLGVMRCLGRKRIPLYCLSEGLESEARSRWCRRLSQRIREFATISDLEQFLEAIPIEQAVLIGCSDHWVVESARLGARLRKRFRVCSRDSQVVGRFVNKGAFAELVKTVNVPHPFTEIVGTEQDVIGLLKQSAGQLFLKPADSQRFHAAFGVKALRFDDMEGTLSSFRRAREAGLDMLVQEYIPGPPDHHYFVDGYVDRTHRLHASFARRRLRMFPPDFGNSTCMISVPLGDVAGAVGSIEKLFEATGYCGIFSAEFKLDERDGQFKILEVNCRPWWYIQFAAECGVDVMEMAYRDALEIPLQMVGAYKIGARLVFHYYDRHALRDMRRRGQPILKEFACSWVRAKTPVFSWDDPLPAVSDAGRRIVKKLSLR